MIHIRTQLADINDQPVLHISLVGTKAIEQLEEILARALNCADPQKYKDWVEVSDGVNAFIAKATPI